MADQWASAPELHGELAEAEEVAAKLVEVICDRESDYRNALWELGVAHDMHDAVTEVLYQTRAEVERVLDERDAARADLSDRTEEVSLLRQQRDEARAEVEAWKRIAQVTQNDLDESASTAVRWYDDLQEARAEVAALREQIAAMEQRWSCQTCGQSPVWTECGNARCKVKVHPYCACNRDDEVDGHWCDDGCPSKALADLRAKVKRMRDEAKADPVGSAVWRTTAYESVLTLIEEAERG